MSGERYLQIGEVAEQLGLTPRTLRYYEEIGLLAPPSRMEGGFRLYSAADITRLENIVQLKRLLGFSLAEIKQVVEAMDPKAATPGEQARRRLGDQARFVAIGAADSGAAG